MDIRRTLFLLLCCGLAVDRAYSIGQVRSEITLTDNGYTGILIAVDEDVAESAETITKIKDAFTKASAELYTATKYRAYFEEITILVPEAWNGTYDPAMDESFDKANIVINTDRTQEHARVEVLNAECGAPGEAMFLADDYVTNSFPASTYLYNPIARTLVHEWAHLRWGVFDEYPGDYDPQFYLDGEGNIQPVRCSSSLEGTVGSEMQVGLDGTVTILESDCDIDPATSLPMQWLCYFMPNQENPGAEASLMAFSHVDKVPYFCDSDTEVPTELHNAEADNTHNTVCGGLSVWDVMRKHADFAEGANLAGDPAKPTQPTFKVVKKGAAMNKNVVLILDISGSMEKNRRLERLRQDATIYLQQIVEDGSSVGMVEFNEVSNIIQQLKTISSSTDRDDLVAVLPDKHEKATCIGCGLRDGLQVLGDKCGDLLLISDGIENRSPFIADVIDEIKAKTCVRVDALLYTKDAEPNMIRLAEETGGKAYFASDSETVADLLNALIAIGNEGQSPTADIAVQVKLEVVVVPPGEVSVDVEVVIDASIGKKTAFSFTYNSGDSLTVELESPEGVSIPDACKEVSNVGLITCELDSAEVGIWKAILKSSGGTSSQCSATSHAAQEGTPAIKVEATVVTEDVSGADGSTIPTPKIVAKVTQGYTPITGAEVIAFVSQGADPIEILLSDSGAGADFEAMDGLYSAYIVGLTGTGKYAAEIKVTNKHGNASAVFNAPSLGAYDPQRVIQSSKGLLPKLENIPGPLERVGSAGFFEATDDMVSSSGQDIYPPAKINDLKVIGASGADNTFTLTWTAVGDDLDQGKASKYELSYCDNITTARTSLASCTKVTASQIVKGSLTPSDAYTREEIKVKLEDLAKDTTIYFALRVKDDGGHWSQRSNIVATGVTLKLTYSYSGNTGKLSSIMIAGLVVTAVLLLMALAGIAFGIWYTKTSNSKANRPPAPYPDFKSGIPGGWDNPQYGHPAAPYPNEPPYVVMQ